MLERLHADRFSVVYRARRLTDDRPFVLKINGPEVPAEQALARYEHEREVLIRSSQPRKSAAAPARVWPSPATQGGTAGERTPKQ